MNPPLLAQLTVQSIEMTGEPAQWSPYLAGALIGVLSWLTFLASQRPIGASGAYAATAGLIGRMIGPAHTARLKYFADNPPRIDWEWMLVIGVVIGALVAAQTGGDATGRWLPPMWAEHFGQAVWLRLLVGFVGGCVMAYGARLAGGCTSGHGISGALQLSVGSWVALACFFVGGVAAAFLMFRLRV
tara:strand:- start:32832 stop:33392 length:561 start_codon:yes stop_codon:yes gene_type:complete